MFTTLKTLFDGAAARNEERTRDSFAVELIDQKIREAETGLRAAKATLASLIQRQRGETRQLTALEGRISDLTERAREALEKDRNDLANGAAQAIATMENERAVRQDTLARLDEKVLRLRASVEAAHRRIVDLKQGAISARAIKREQVMQSRLNRTLDGRPPAEEAEELIARVLGRDDPFEQSQILQDIDADLDHSNIADRLADEGFGKPTKVTASDVLARLKTK